MTKERDQALNANIESIFDNSNLKADIKKFEDQEALRGQKWKREKDYVAPLKVLQPTSRWDGESKINKPKFLSPREKTSGVATNVYSRKTLEKLKRGLRILKIRVRELFMHREGISTPCARHKGRQPLIECAQCDFKIIYFSLFKFFIFLGSTKGLALILRILRCDEEYRPT